MSNYRHPRSRLRTFCCDAFACASIAVAAWDKILPRAMADDSLAKSASITPERADSTFTVMLVRFEIVLSRRFETAPRSERDCEIFWIALSITLIASEAPLAVDRLISATDSRLDPSAVEPKCSAALEATVKALVDVTSTEPVIAAEFVVWPRSVALAVTAPDASSESTLKSAVEDDTAFSMMSSPLASIRMIFELSVEDAIWAVMPVWPETALIASRRPRTSLASVMLTSPIETAFASLVPMLKLTVSPAVKPDSCALVIAVASTPVEDDSLLISSASDLADWPAVVVTAAEPA